MTTTQEITFLIKAPGDENRVQILKLLRNGKMCACKLLKELNISQPTLSHHMKILCDCGIVRGRREGKWTHYRISNEGVDRACVLLHALLLPEENNSQISHV